MLPNYRSCPSHCCPVHGCKYGYASCPVRLGEFVPEPSKNWPNNGCERCEMEREDLRYLEERAGEPIRPVSEYCHALRQYADALRECADGGEPGPFGSTEICRDVADALQSLSFAAGKSNLLSRLIYQREDLRTRRCPTHKGRWSGIAYDENRCACEDRGGNLTGWLPNE